MRKLLPLILLLTLGALCPAQTLKAKASGGHTVTLQGCVDSNPAASFNFYRGTVAGQESTTALNPTPLATCSYVDATVLGNTTYYYVAKAYLASASPPLSGPSNEVTAVVPPDAQPAAPTGLTLGPVAQNHVPLQWNAPPPQNGYAVVAYEILRGTKPALPAPAIIGIVPSSVTAWMDGSCSKCYYAVRSMTIKGQLSFVLSGMSNIVGPS